MQGCRPAVQSRLRRTEFVVLPGAQGSEASLRRSPESRVRRVLEHTIDIHATPEQVWEALTGFDAYAGWNPFMRSVSGAPQVGSKLRIELAPPDGRPIVVSPSVVVADPGRELRWRGALPLGLFTGEHAFVISPAETGARVVHRGWYRGFLVRLFSRV